MTNTTTQTIERNNEDLRVGDMCKLWCGLVRIVGIRPYVGPLSGIIFALADFDRGVGMSLEIGGTTTVVA